MRLLFKQYLPSMHAVNDRQVPICNMNCYLCYNAERRVTNAHNCDYSRPWEALLAKLSRVKAFGRLTII